MAKRSYGSGSLFMKHGEWYGRWWVGDQRVKRALGPVREAGNRRGLTRAQAEREMRRRMEAETVVLSVRSTDVGRGRGALRRSPRACDGEKADHGSGLPRLPQGSPRALLRGSSAGADRRIERYGLSQAQAGAWFIARDGSERLGLPAGVFSFAVRRGWAASNRVSSVDRPRRTGPPKRRIRHLQPVELDDSCVASGRRRWERGAIVVPDGGDDRLAAGRTDRAALARRRLAGRPGAGGG
jgi:hypothetical protein